MRCWICEQEGASRRNRVLDHFGLDETYRFVCDDCYVDVKKGEYESYSVIKLDLKG